MTINKSIQVNRITVFTVIQNMIWLFFYYYLLTYFLTFYGSAKHSLSAGANGIQFTLTKILFEIKHYNQHT